MSDKARKRGRAGGANGLPTSVNKTNYLTALRAGYLKGEAIKRAGVSWASISNWRKNDPEFCDNEDHAFVEGNAALEAEARRRAVEGVSKPVFHNGLIVGHIQEFSDRLLERLLMARDPYTYCAQARTARLEREAAAKLARDGDGSTATNEQLISDLETLAQQRRALLLEVEELRKLLSANNIAAPAQ